MPIVLCSRYIFLKTRDRRKKKTNVILRILLAPVKQQFL